MEALEKIGKLGGAMLVGAIVLILAAASTVIAPLGVVAVAGLALVVLGLRNPMWILFAACFLIPFDKMAVLVPPSAAGLGNVGFLSTLTLTKLVLLALIGVLFLRTMLFGREDVIRVAHAPIFLLVVAFVVVSFLSMGNIRDAGFFFLSMTRRINLLVLVALLVYLVRTPRHIERILFLMVVAYAGIAAMGIFEIATQTTVMSVLGFPTADVMYLQEGQGFRPIGSFGDPNTLAVNMAGAGLIAITLLAYRPSWRRAWPTALLFAAIVFVILGSASRGGILALVAGCGVFLVFARIRGRFAATTLSLVIGGVVFLGFTENVSKLARARILGEVGTESVGYRVGWLEMALEMAADHPIIGVGPSQFLRYYPKYRVDSVPRESYYPHNTYVQVLAENGLVGLLIFLGLWGYAFSRVITAYRHARTPRDQILATGLGAMLTAFGVFAVTSNTLEIEIYWITFALAALLPQAIQRTPVPEVAS
jgi:O-antigen ligase